MFLLSVAKKLPDSPGVYMFTGKNKQVLYVGRTISLKKRVMSYFQKDKDPRIAEMVSLAKHIRYVKTDTILEAIVLEANFIKKYWPKYNVKDKDNRSFIYIAVTDGDYPRPIIVRQRELDKFPKNFRIFGPYQSASLINTALRIMRRIFPYSTCVPNSGKPCFDYQIGLCPGACVGKISKSDYQKNIKNIILFLSGKKKLLVKKLKKENPEAVKAIKHIQDVSLITKENILPPYGSGRIEGYDISHLAGRETFGAMVVFENGRPDKDNYRLFKIKSAPQNDDLRALEEVILRRFKHKEWKFPDLILIDGGKPQVDFISKTIKKIHLNIPFMGISKFGNDKIVFPRKTSRATKELISGIKKNLLSVRDEAHRFSLKSSRRSRRNF